MSDHRFTDFIRVLLIVGRLAACGLWLAPLAVAAERSRPNIVWFVVDPVCSPSRSAMITGMYQTAIGAHHHRSGRGVRTIHLPDGDARADGKQRHHLGRSSSPTPTKMARH